MGCASLLVALAVCAHGFAPSPHARQLRSSIRPHMSSYEEYMASRTDDPSPGPAAPGPVDDGGDDAPEGGVQFLTALATEEQVAEQVPQWVKAEQYKAGVVQESQNFGPTTYEGFVDSEGFDGGDGQVGVVGDGESQMETFDKTQVVEKSMLNNAIGGKDSKSAKTKVAFGYSSGYADTLKEQGMTEVDEYGEDRLQARRQQLENWRNQQEVKGQRDAVQKYHVETSGGTYDRRTHQSGHYLEQNNQADAAGYKQRYAGPSGFAEGVIVAEDGGIAHGDEFVANENDIAEEIRLTAMAGGRGAGEVLVRNLCMTYEDYAAGFSAGTPRAFSVSPAEGTLNGARGDPTTLSIAIDASTLAGGQTYEGFLVVDTEEEKYTYKILVSVQ